MHCIELVISNITFIKYHISNMHNSDNHNICFKKEKRVKQFFCQHGVSFDNWFEAKCSRNYHPDLVIHNNDHIIIVEVDKENNKLWDKEYEVECMNDDIPKFFQQITEVSCVNPLQSRFIQGVWWNMECFGWSVQRTLVNMCSWVTWAFANQLMYHFVLQYPNC